MRADRLIFHIPGGGFVCMSPICHDDYVSTWAKQTGVPILSIDYGKAPEHPYPFALEEVFDAYRAVVQSNGQVLGLDGWTCSTTGAPKPPIKVIVTGDSA